MLRLDRVSKFYSTNGVVTSGFNKVSLDFNIGEFVAITGESGSGKSTLLNVISGLDSYEEGEMYIYGQPTSGYDSADMENYRKRYIGNIFQTFNLINHYTVYQNVEMVLLLSGYDDTEVKARVLDIIHKVGLDDYINTKASKLSGGQKQRVAIARALAKETPIIVADEPTGNLDVASAAEIIRLLASLSKDKLIIIVTHNFEQVEPYITRKISMHDGKVAEDKIISRAASASHKQDAEEAIHDGLTTKNTARLGARNAFSLPAKFLLLLFVFIFLSVGTFASYSAYIGMKDGIGNNSWGFVFQNVGPSRMVVSKTGEGTISTGDINKLEELDNIDFIEVNDYLEDQRFIMTNQPRAILYSDDEAFEEVEVEFWIEVKTRGVKTFGDREIIAGRLPEADDEALMLIIEDSWISENQVEDIFGNTAYISLEEVLVPADDVDIPIKIVGYAYFTKEEVQNYWRDSHAYYDSILLLTEEGENRLEAFALVKPTIIEAKAGNEILKVGENLLYYDVWLCADPSVKQGTVRIPDYVAEYDEDEIAIRTRSKYFDRTESFKVSQIIPEETRIHINPDDLWKLYEPTEPAQVTAMLKSNLYFAETRDAIEEAGYKALYLNESADKQDATSKALLNAMRVFVLVMLLGVLFFIIYFITKLIMKSQNVYYSTVRMLGGSPGACTGILLAELVVIFHLGFAVCVGIMAKINLMGSSILPDYMVRLIRYIQPTDYIILYIVVLIMTLLVAYRYSSQMFKKTAMNAYREEV